MFNILRQISAEKYEHIFNTYKQLLLSDKDTKKYVVADPVINYNPGAFRLIFQIRCNELFDTNDIKPYNDWMVTIENLNGKPQIEVYAVTVDPKTRQNDIFNVLEQINWRTIGYHRVDLFGKKRICLRQDREKDKTWGNRYRLIKGKWQLWKEVFGNLGINTHDPNSKKKLTRKIWEWIINNTSLGCTILKNQQTYEDYFKPALYRVLASGQGNDIPLAIIRDKTFLSILQGEPAIAINGKNINRGEARP